MPGYRQVRASVAREWMAQEGIVRAIETHQEQISQAVLGFQAFIQSRRIPCKPATLWQLRKRKEIVGPVPSSEWINKRRRLTEDPSSS